MAQCMKNKFLYNNSSIQKTDKIFCNKCFGLDWHNNIKDKTIFFTNKINKYKKENLKTIIK